MTTPSATVLLSRTIVAFLCAIIWMLLYLNARAAYRVPTDKWTNAIRILRIGAAVVIFILQVNVMERLSPGDAYGGAFFCFVLIEAGGGLVVLFTTLIRARSRSLKRKRAGL